METSPLQCMASRNAEGDLRAGALTIKRPYGGYRSGEEDNDVSLNGRVIVTSPCARCGNVQSHHVRQRSGHNGSTAIIIDPVAAR